MTHFCSDTCSHCSDEVKVKNLQQFLLWKHMWVDPIYHCSSLHVMIHFWEMNRIMVNHLLSSQANTSYLIPLIHPLHTLSNSFDKLKRKASLFTEEYHWHMSFDIKLSWEIYCFTYTRKFEYFIMAIDQEVMGWVWDGIYLTESGWDLNFNFNFYTCWKNHVKINLLKCF